MVDSNPYKTAAQAEKEWEQHLDGANGVPATNVNQLVVSLYAEGGKNCKNYAGSIQPDVVTWVQQKQTRGLFYWSVGCDNTCVENCSGIQQTSEALLT
eukprot:TRINITY_DN6088_c2_g1_i1.p1 TRINITY_DN6088_c2_g1~~TRINITY_DN6088_c2_g1_i1.p1  ORF type:complete len:109 (-),score=6.98 TRINITY_DN6088_c2_g1_i1:37-330(-)